MRTILAVVFAVLLIGAIITSVHAQQGKIVVDEGLLTSEQLAKAKAAQVKDTVSDNVKWGREVGLAVKEALASLTDEAAKFSKTEPGKITMFLVAWKVMAKDILSMSNKIVGYLIGIPFLVIGLIMTLWSYRRQCVPRKVVKEKGPGFWIWRSKKYEVYDPAERKDTLEQEYWVWIHIGVAIVIIVISAITIFTG